MANLGVALLMLFVATLVIAEGAATALSRTAPSIARVVPWNAQGFTRTAELSLVARPSKQNYARAASFSRLALRRDLTDVAAVRTLGEAERLLGKKRQGSQLAKYAQRLSWRDLPTQIFAGRDAALAGDGQTVLRHYSAALLTNRSSWPQMMPALVNATADPELAPLLAKILSTKPQWIDLFNSQWIPNAPRPETMPLLSRELDRLGASVSFETRVGILARLVATKKWELVRDEYSRGRPQLANAGRTLSDGFNNVGTLRPLDWQLNDVGDLLAAVENDRQAKRLLSVEFDGPGEVEVARRLIFLPAGRYRFVTSVETEIEAVLGNSREYGTALNLVCATDEGRELAHSSYDSSGAVQMIADVPGACDAQWLLIKQKLPVDGVMTSRILPITLLAITK